MKTKTSLIIILFSVITLVAQQTKDPIIGVWKVKNKYYTAQFEILQTAEKFYGKIIHYTDGKDTYKATHTKKDIFLTDIEKSGKRYINGKMYMPDGSFYKVIFTFKNSSTLKVLMTVENQPYEEVWKKVTKAN